MKQPAPVYQRIAGHQWRHIWLSGDIHGCLEQLRRKLWHCRFDPWRDLLISVGDVIDRGPQSLRCLQLLEQHWVCAVRGDGCAGIPADVFVVDEWRRLVYCAGR